MTSQTEIAQRVVESILAQKLAPGGAEQLMVTHIGSVQDTWDGSTAGSTDTRERLRASLAPLKRAGV